MSWVVDGGEEPAPSALKCNADTPETHKKIYESKIRLHLEPESFNLCNNQIYHQA